MSAQGYAVPPYVFEQQGTFDAPFTYTVPASLEIRPDTATATFDGSGAGGDFLACLTFYSPEGSLLCRMFNPTPVKQGDTAVVTYIPPFGSAASSSGTGATGIQYDVDNEGDWLDIGINGTIPHTSNGMRVHRSATAQSNIVLDVETTNTSNLIPTIFGASVTAENNITATAAEAVGLEVTAADDNGGQATAIITQAGSGADVVAVKATTVPDGGGTAIGLWTDAAIAFSGTQVAADLAHGVGYIYLKAAGGGQHSLVARVGTTEAVLVTG